MEVVTIYKLEDTLKFPSTYGVYALCNNWTAKFYIGTALSSRGKSKRKGFKARWGEHVRKLKKNKHENPYLQNAFNKQGIENFHFRILKEAELPSSSFYDIEKEYASTLGDYNIRLVAQNPAFKKPSKKAISVVRISKTNLEDNKVFKSITEAANETKNGSICHIVSACKRDYNSHAGFYWCYLEDYPTFKPKGTFYVGVSSEKHRLTLVGLKRPPRYELRRKIAQYTLEGEYLNTFASITLAASNLKIKRKSIGECLAGRNKTSKGFIFKYVTQ